MKQIVCVSLLCMLAVFVSFEQSVYSGVFPARDGLDGADSGGDAGDRQNADQGGAPEVTTLDDSNFLEYTSRKPVVGIPSISGCYEGVTKQAINGFRDVRGINLGLFDANADTGIVSKLNSHYDNTDTPDDGLWADLVLFYKGKVIHVLGEPGYKPAGTELNFGPDVRRRWLAVIMKKHGFPCTMKYPPMADDFGAPEAVNGTVDLARGKVAHYDFSSLRDLTGNNGDFCLVGESKILNGCYTPNTNGSYDAVTDGYFYFANRARMIFADRFTLAVNINPQIAGDEYPKTFMELGPRLMDIGVKRGGLCIIISPDSSEDDQQAPWHFAYGEKNARVIANQWNNIIVTMDVDRGRLGVLLNGKRLKDILLSPMLIDHIRRMGRMTNGDYKGCGFTSWGFGSTLPGFADDLILYDRRLNDSELQALYNSVKR